jgi:hypothetical protein
LRVFAPSWFRSFEGRREILAGNPLRCDITSASRHCAIEIRNRYALFGIPNFWNVVSNLPLSWSGPWGCGNSVATEQASCFSSGFS